MICEYQQDKLAAAMSDANKLLNKPHDDTALEEYRKKVLPEAEQKCPACGGNDGDMPCAYPGEHEQQPGCLRAARLPPNVELTGGPDTANKGDDA